MGEKGFQVALALLHDQHLSVQALGGAALQDNIDQPIQVTIDLLDLRFGGVPRFGLPLTVLKLSPQDAEAFAGVNGFNLPGQRWLGETEHWG